MRPGPRRSPLFPYTTLFRSRVQEHRTKGYNHVSAVSRTLVACHLDPACQLRCQYRRTWPVSCTTLNDKRASHYKDRKSTRLNSSHVELTYAVLCLKKKKITY